MPSFPRVGQRGVLRETDIQSRETAIVFGVGPGLGWALAQRFVSENMQVGVVARDITKLHLFICARI